MQLFGAREGVCRERGFAEKEFQTLRRTSQPVSVIRKLEM